MKFLEASLLRVSSLLLPAANLVFGRSQQYGELSVDSVLVNGDRSGTAIHFEWLIKAKVLCFVGYDGRVHILTCYCSCAQDNSLFRAICSVR